MSLSALQIAALAVILIPTIVPVRVLMQAGARRRLMAFPRFVWKTVWGFLIYLSGLTVLTLAAPGWLVPVASVVVIAILIERWRGRPGYGGSRSLPSGSLALGQVEPWRNQNYFQNQIDRHGPVFKTRMSPRPLIGVYGLERARRLLSEHDEVLGPGEPMPFHRLIPGGFLRYIERDRHDELVPVFRRAFSATLISANQERISQQIRSSLEKQALNENSLDTEYMHELLFPVFTGLFFGIWEPGRVSELREEYGHIDLRHTLFLPRWRAKKAVQSIESTLMIQVRGIASKSSEQNLSALTNLARASPLQAQDPTVLRNLIFLTMTSWLDVAALTVWLFKMLSDHPAATDAIRAEVTAARPPSGLPLTLCAVREAIRLEQSEFLSRTVLKTFEFEGFRFPKGWRVRILEHENHRDPSLFERADEFWPQRFIEAPPPPSSYAGFGASRITCLGEHLTLGIDQIFVEELLGNFTWTVISDGPTEFGGLHWRPSSRFRIALDHREAAQPPVDHVEPALEDGPSSERVAAG